MNPVFHLFAAVAMVFAGGLLCWNESRKWEPDWVIEVCGMVMAGCGVLAGGVQVAMLVWRGSP